MTPAIPDKQPLDTLNAQALSSLKIMKTSHREILENIRHAYVDKDLTVHPEVLDKITEICGTTQHDVVFDAGLDCLRVAVTAEGSTPAVLDNFYTLANAAIEKRDETKACVIIDCVIKAIREKPEWATPDMNELFQKLKITHDNPPPVTAMKPKDILGLGKNLVQKAFKKVSQPLRELPQSARLPGKLLELQYTFDELMIEQFQKALKDNPRRKKGFIERNVRGPLRKFWRDSW